jgi:cytoskeletal protein CcmA (bactofilin family)
MFSVIGPDMVVTGNIAASADLHVEGRIEGDLDCGSLVQGTESRINGAVRAEIARIAGTVTGSVSVRQLSIERTTRITGDVEYETIAIENGASIDGRLKHVAIDSGSQTFDRTPASVAPVQEIRHEERTSLVSTGEAA